MPRIVRDIQLLVNDNDDHLYGYRLSDGTEVRIGSSRPDNAAAVVGEGARAIGAQRLNTTGSPPYKQWVELLSCGNAALWDDRAGAGMTVAVDTAVLFDGKPTLRLTIPAGSSGTYRVGTTAAVCLPPYNWDGKGLSFAVMSSNTAAVSSASVFLGDSAFANFGAFGGQNSVANVPEAAWVENEWMVFRGTQITPTGSPAYPGAKRLRVNLPVTSVGTETTVWIGFVGVVAPHKTTVIVSIDDGYRSGYDFIAPLSRYYKIPVSFGIDRFYPQTGAANYMTPAMTRELHADPSDLFEFVTHGYNNTNVSTAGDATYVQQQIDTRAYLRSLGVMGDGPDHHPWVQSIYTNGAAAGLKSAGFKSARIGGSAYKSMHDGLWQTGQDKRVFQQVNCATLTTGLTLAAAQQLVTDAVTEGYGVTHVNAHDFATADAASPPTWAYNKAIDLWGWLDAQRTAGNIEIKTWGRWHADLYGYAYRK